MLELMTKSEDARDDRRVQWIVLLTPLIVIIGMGIAVWVSN